MSQLANLSVVHEHEPEPVEEFAPSGLERPPVTWGKDYTHPSDGSTLVLLQQPSGMSKTQIAQWALFTCLKARR